MLCSLSNSPKTTATPVIISAVKRRVRGGSQAFLVAAAERHYIAKLYDNPQGNRTLVNEWLVSTILRRLGVLVPEWCVLELSPDTLNRNLLLFELGSKKIAVQGRYHFGSKVPVDLENVTVYDFLPLSMLSKVENLADFATVFVADRWLSQQDTRQAVFVRDRASANGLMFRAYMIDHGGAFGGSRWSFTDSALNGLYWDKAIYSLIDMYALCHQAAIRIASLDVTDLYAVVDEMPAAWLPPRDRTSVNQLLTNIHRRQSNILEITRRHLRDLQKFLPPKSA